MLILSIDKHSAVPAYRQICERVISLVGSGDLVSGDRLPPTRDLARMAGVHRSTVLRAYGELWSLGYLQSRPGSYSIIRCPEKTSAVEPAGRPTVIDWATVAERTGLGVDDASTWTPPVRFAERDVVNFATLSADPRMSPVDDLRRCLKAVLVEEGGALLDYSQASGHPSMKEAIVRRMRVHGIDVSTDEVMITNGAQQGLDLVLRLLAAPGERIVVESPTYAAAIPLFRLHRLTLDAVPMLANGMDLDALDTLLQRARPSLVYTMPTFHNPTGISTSREHRERLLGLCERFAVPLVEDGFEEDLKYFGKAALPIKSMDRNGAVVYVGTFSKVVFAGLRIGWIAAPRECIRRLVGIQRASCIGGIALAQAAAARLCDLGLYDSFLKRVHASYRKRMETMLKCLGALMPAGVEWTRPAGGSTLWLTIKSPWGEESIREHMLQNGVMVASGRPFFPEDTADAHFRISISCVKESEIEEGCRRLARALETVVRS